MFGSEGMPKLVAEDFEVESVVEVFWLDSKDCVGQGVVAADDGSLGFHQEGADCVDGSQIGEPDYVDRDGGFGRFGVVWILTSPTRNGQKKSYPEE